MLNGTKTCYGEAKGTRHRASTGTVLSPLTLKPSSRAQAYTEAVLPDPGGPVISRVVDSCSNVFPSEPASPWKAPQSQRPATETHPGYRCVSRTHHMNWIYSEVLISNQTIVVVWAFPLSFFFLIVSIHPQSPFLQPTSKRQIKEENYLASRLSVQFPGAM